MGSSIDVFLLLLYYFGRHSSTLYVPSVQDDTTATIPKRIVFSTPQHMFTHNLKRQDFENKYFEN